MNKKLENTSEKDLFLRKLGAHIRSVRESKGIKAVDLASLCEMPRNSISRIELGITNPTAYTLKKIADSLEISISELLDELN